ncbi:MAG: zinc metalloprotease HtpX [Paracoccaceae bacterium]
MRASREHARRNLAHAVLLIAAMAAIGFAAAALALGPVGGLAALVVLALAAGAAPRAPKGLLLRAYRARPLDARRFPLGVALVDALARRAGLPRAPALWYVPSSVPHAFAVGAPEDSVVAVSDGMLRLVDERELAGVLAHEVSHIAHRDLWLMALADATGRVTAFASLAGQVALVVSLPLAVMGMAHPPLLSVALLILAPGAVNLLQLALSRSREFEADRGAAELTGDPGGLASALAKLERRTGRLWEDLLMPGRRTPEPSLLRTHPPSGERIARLRALAPPPRPVLAPPGRAEPWPARPLAPPRYRRAGFWY